MMRKFSLSKRIASSRGVSPFISSIFLSKSSLAKTSDVISVSSLSAASCSAFFPDVYYLFSIYQLKKIQTSLILLIYIQFSTIEIRPFI